MRENSRSVREDLKATFFADAGEFDALLEFAFELGGALDVGDGNFVQAAVDVDVAGDLLDLGGTFFEIQSYVAGDVFDGNVAVLVVDLDFAVAAGDGDIAAARSDLQRHLARDGDIEIALHGVVAGGLSFGVEG